MQNSLLFNFGEIWLKSLYYSTGTLAQFLSNFKNLPILNRISSNCLHNISTCICIKQNYKNGEFPQFLGRIFEQLKNS